MISLGCFNAVHDFMCHSLPPFCTYVGPPYSELVSEGDRSIIFILVLPLLVFFRFLGGPSVLVRIMFAEDQSQNILLLLSQISLQASVCRSLLIPEGGGLLGYLVPFLMILSRCPGTCQ